MADIGIGISIGMNLKLGICIWYQSEFRVSVSGIGISMYLGYQYHYGSSAGYQYQGISGTIGKVESGQVRLTLYDMGYWILVISWGGGPEDPQLYFGFSGFLYAT